MQNIIVKRRKVFCLLVLLHLSFVGAFAQITVSGIVRDSKGVGLPGVTVAVKGSTGGTSTDEKGSFSIRVPDQKARLQFSHLGMRSLELPVNKTGQMSVTLEEDASKMNEVVVIGYGSQSRQLLTTAVAKVDNKALESVPLTNVGEALQGAVPGLLVQNTSGEPGTASRIILRGGTSINNPNGAAPLYIIDGVIRDAGLNELSSADIESIQVLKDAASTAIYGARGSNGVIIITTKSGKAGKTAVNFSYNLTNSHPGRRIEFASAHDYIYYNRLGTQYASVINPALAARLTQANGSGTGNDLTNNTAYTTQYLSAANQDKLKQGWSSMPDPIDPSKTLIYKETNYNDLIYRTGWTNQYNLSASGGSDKSTFNVGAGYLTNQATVIGSTYKRINLTLNGSLKLRDNLTVFARALYAHVSNSPVANYSWSFYRYPSLPGTAKFRFEDGTMAPGQNQSIGNPDYFMVGPYARQGKNQLEDLLTIVGARWNITNGLVFEPQVSLLRSTYYNYFFQPAALINGVGSLVTTRTATAYDSLLTQYQADGVLTYTRTFASSHHLEAKAGITYYSRNLNAESATGQGAATDAIPTLNAAATPVSVGGSNSDLRMQGLFGRINYNYAEKYLLSLNYRYDGASNLGTAHRFGGFPGISAGWNLYKEDFWENVFHDAFTLKLRGSYGVNGNISGLGDFQALGNYSVGSRYNGNAAVLTAVLPNSDLQWEKSKTLDGGMDATFLNRRITLLFDYYHRVTSNLLTTVSLPVSSGYASVYTNLGTLQNNGLEGSIDFNLLPDRSPIHWNITVNAAYIKTKILKLPYNGVPKNRIGGVNVYDPGSKSYQWKGGLQEGGRIGDMYGYKLIGVFATDGEAAKAPYDVSVNGNNKRKYGGDANFRDVDGNDTIDSRDQVYLGNPYPKWTGGLSSQVTYKNFSLFVRAAFTLGATIYNYPAVFADGQLQGDGLPTARFIKNSWKKQGDVTMTPRYVWQDQWSDVRADNYYYEKSDFLAIREITLAYTLPADWVRRMRVSNVRLNLTGSNLHYFTGYTGQNPDDGGQDNGHFPVPVSFTFAARVSF